MTHILIPSLGGIHRYDTQLYFMGGKSCCVFLARRPTLTYPTSIPTTTIVVSDGTTTLKIATATYNSIGEQVTAIKNHADYASLLFTIAEASGGIQMTYKSCSGITTVPRITGNVTGGTGYENGSPFVHQVSCDYTFSGSINKLSVTKATMTATPTAAPTPFHAWGVDASVSGDPHFVGFRHQMYGACDRPLDRPTQRL